MSSVLLVGTTALAGCAQTTDAPDAAVPESLALIATPASEAGRPTAQPAQTTPVEPTEQPSSRGGEPLTGRRLTPVAIAAARLLDDAGVDSFLKLPDDETDTIHIGVWSDTLSLQEIQAIVSQEAVAAVQPAALLIDDWEERVVLQLTEPLEKGAELPD